MGYYISKIAVSALLITLISEIGRRHSLAGALLASVPIISMLAAFWLYIDTGSTVKTAEFLTNIFWLTLPSLIFFVSVPLLLKGGVNFYISILLSILLSGSGYLGMMKLLSHFKITGS